MIERGRKLLEDYCTANGEELTNERLTKMMGFFHINNRDTFLLKVGSDEIDVKEYKFNYTQPRENKGIISRILRFGGLKKNDTPASSPREDSSQVAPVPDLDTKKPYLLRYGEHEQNFVLCDCCNPIPGDDVMGFLNHDNRVEVHSLTCPRAQALKAAYGPRIVTTMWEEVRHKFLANVRIEGIDRHGILQELIQMISTHLSIDIRSLHIDAEKEVFECRLGVLVRDTAVVTDLCDKIKKIPGVQSATRVS